MIARRADPTAGSSCDRGAVLIELPRSWADGIEHTGKVKEYDSHCVVLVRGGDVIQVHPHLSAKCLEVSDDLCLSMC